MEKEIQNINKKLKAVMAEEPLVEIDASSASGHESLYGLAQVFANKGFRDYMIHLINSQLKSLLDVDSEVSHAYIKGRIIMLKELLNKAKQSYEEVVTLEQKQKNAIEKREK